MRMMYSICMNIKGSVDRDIRCKAYIKHAHTSIHVSVASFSMLYNIYIHIPLTARVMPAGVAPTGGVGVAGEGNEGAGPWSE